MGRVGQRSADCSICSVWKDSQLPLDETLTHRSLVDKLFFPIKYTLKIKTHGSWQFVRLFLSFFYPKGLKGSLQFFKILMHVIKFFKRLINGYACSAKWFKLICQCSSSCNIWLLNKNSIHQQLHFFSPVSDISYWKEQKGWWFDTVWWQKLKNSPCN